MTTRQMETKNDQPTLTEFISGFGIEYRWLYADGGGRPRVDPDTDWAVFSARDSFAAWEMLRCLASHIAAIRSSVWLNDDGDIIVPLDIAEITAASAALQDFWRDFDRRTYALRMYEHKYAPTGRIARAIHYETIQGFLCHWEGTDADFREPWRPTQWTHEFPVALGELLKTLEKTAALLVGIAGTSWTGDTDDHELAGLSIQEHLARHDLGLPSTVNQRRFGKRLLSQDIYTAAHLVRSLDSVEAGDGRDSWRAANRLAHILRASEAIHTTHDAAIHTLPLRSRMTVIMAAFLRDVVAPTLRVYGACAAVHLVLDAARTRSPVGGARAAFIGDFVAPLLRYPTDDMPHYGRFALRLRRLHALARELAGDIHLFSGEAGELEDASPAPDCPVSWY